MNVISLNSNNNKTDLKNAKGAEALTGYTGGMAMVMTACEIDNAFANNVAGRAVTKGMNII